MIKISDKKLCTGCNACGDICPKDAITFSEDNEGFWYPSVKSDLCINCGACEKVCPIKNKPTDIVDNFSEPKCFAAINKNLYVRFDSTSGGAFSSFANQVFKEGGVVGGATTEDDFSAKQTIIDSKFDLEKIRSSKYYQSDASGYYSAIKAELVSGKKVLACGAPCQMAALRNYLGKEYDNLIIVDFICLCMPSPKVFKKYIDYIGEKTGSSVTKTKAKSKELGWRNLTQMFELENGNRIYEIHSENPFQFFYMDTRTIVRPSCYDCKFKGFPRLSDITIGDYWRPSDNSEEGITFYKEYDNDLGTSVIIVNNEKGMHFLDRCKSTLKFVQVPFDSVVSGNPALTRSIESSLINRDIFYKELDEHSFEYVCQKYFDKRNRQKKHPFLRRWYHLYSRLGFSIPLYAKLIKHNGFLKSLFSTNPIIIQKKYAVVKITNRKNVILDGNLLIGEERIKGSKLETRFFTEGNGKLSIHGDVKIGYGSDIEVLDGGHLEMGHCWTNMNTEIICADHISIGNNVGIGRNVSIRDNNGGHYIDRNYYQNTRPVIIEDKVWIGSNVIIMPGVHIGTGAVVSEGSFVCDNVPPHTIVAGNPAKVVDEDVLFNWDSGSVVGKIV